MNFKFPRNPQHLLEQYSTLPLTSLQAETEFLDQLQLSLPLRPFWLIVGGFMDQYLGHGMQVAQELKHHLPKADIYFREYYEVESMLRLINIYAKKYINPHKNVVPECKCLSPTAYLDCLQKNAGQACPAPLPTAQPNNSPGDQAYCQANQPNNSPDDQAYCQASQPNNSPGDQTNSCPSSPSLNLIGHSWGANAVINALIPRLHLPLNLVITLDPVSYQGPPKQRPAQILHWCNVYVDYKQSDLFNNSNLIARIGHPWQRVEQADVNIMAPKNLNHAQAWQLLQNLDFKILQKS